MPLIKGLHQPTVSQDEVERIITLAKGWYRVLFTLLPGSGLRIGEALALEVPDLTGNTLHVRQNLYERKLGTPKTDAGLRQVDLSPELAEMLRGYIGGRTDGFIFRTRTGGPILQRNALRMLHAVLKKAGIEQLGFHAFRRFRITYLRKAMVPEDLLKFWVGHAPQTVTDTYSNLKADVHFRSLVTRKVGLGFELESQLYPVVPHFPPVDSMVQQLTASERLVEPK